MIESWTHINHSLLEIGHLWSCNKLNKSYFKLKPWMSHLKGASRQRNNSESLWGIKPQAFGFWTPMLIADPSCMQDVCHMNFVIDLIHHRSEVQFLMGTQNFSLYHAHHKTKTIFLYFFTKHLSHSIYKHDAIYIIDPNGMQDVCHMNSFTIESLWLSGRASEHRIRRSEIFKKYLPFHKSINLY